MQLELNQNDVLLSRKEAAAFLGVTHRTLERWEVNGAGPPHYRVGHLLRYCQREVFEWLARNRGTPSIGR